MTGFIQIHCDDAEVVAVYLLERYGFSIGPKDGEDTRGIRHGDAIISEWRDLSPRDRRLLHAQMTYSPLGVDICAMEEMPREGDLAFRQLALRVTMLNRHGALDALRLDIGAGQ